MSNELDLMDYFRIIRRRAWLIAIVMVVVCTLVGVYSVYIKEPVYEASTKIIVNQAPTQTNNQIDLNQINTNIQMINTYKEIIKTPAILDKVIEQYPEFQLTTEELIGKINVSSVNNTQVMTLVARDISYQKAAEIANAVSDVFKGEIPFFFNVENVSILNKAKMYPQVIPQPVEPNVMLNLAIGFVISLLISVGISLLLEYMDDTLKTEKDIEQYLGLSTLAMITKLSGEELSVERKTTKESKRGEIEHVTIAR